MGWELSKPLIKQPSPNPTIDVGQVKQIEKEFPKEYWMDYTGRWVWRNMD